MANAPLHQRPTQPRRKQPETAYIGQAGDPSVADLRALIAEQQTRIDALTQQHADLLHQQAQMAALIQQLTRSLEAPIEIIEPAPESESSSTAETTAAPAARTTTSRRGLLKWGGLGAAAALAAAAGTAGAAGLNMPIAHAADGGSLTLGQNNTAEHLTTLTYDGTETAPIAFSIENSGSAFSTGLTVFVGPNGTGILSSTLDAGTGLNGQSDTGYGVVGESQFGIDFFANGGGRIQQKLSGFTGAPTSGSYTQGEQIRDNAGDLYICIASGSPGTWRKVAAGVPGVSGAINFLANPIRLLDTRTGSPYAGGSTHSLQVTGVVIGGISVPSGAVGVVGNVTVVGPTSGGDLRLYPGATAPATSSINFASGQTIANGVVVGLNSSGQLNIRVDMPSGTHTNVLFDASGYIL